VGLVVNLVGDVLNALVRQQLAAAVGIPIVAAILVYLMTKMFESTSTPAKTPPIPPKARASCRLGINCARRTAASRFLARHTR
jgi:hypothetical protein